jgi:hypothetical protein
VNRPKSLPTGLRGRNGGHDRQVYYGNGMSEVCLPRRDYLESFRVVGAAPRQASMSSLSTRVDDGLWICTGGIHTDDACNRGTDYVSRDPLPAMQFSKNTCYKHSQAA